MAVEDPREECGIVGVYTPGEDAARTAFFGLFSLQHRGQESAGIATSDGESLRHKTDMGLVSQVFREENLQSLSGWMAIGHTRYSTTGSSREENCQPIPVSGPRGELSLGHNGNVINAAELKDELLGWGCNFKSGTDSEVIAQLLAYAPGKDWGDSIGYMMNRLQGAYSLVALTKDAVMAIRDPLGVRPLCLGKLHKGWVVASESCALDHVGAEYIREIEPGEAIMIDASGVHTIHKHTDEKRALCVFELIYFARPDSLLNSKLVYSARRNMGTELAREHPVAGDVVIGVPDSSIAAAEGYAAESGITYSEGLVKNRYVGRTFIEPDHRVRNLGVQLKFNPLPEVLRGKRVIVVDDSIVRGTTTPRVVNLIRKAGAKEVHLRICAPPIMWPCHFGIDFATRRELIASNKSVPEISEVLGSDSLGYLSEEGLLKAVDIKRDKLCMACFTGKYPIPVQLELDKLMLEDVSE